MLKLGVIGTSWITQDFVDACIMSERYQLSAIYSRSESKGLQFGEKYGVTNVYTDIDRMCKDIDVVYIASPNGLHYSHSKRCLLNGVHVICEKPSMTSVRQLEEIKSICLQNDRFFFEAIRTIYTGKYDFLKEQMNKIGKIRFANLNFMKISSKYDAFKNGEEPSAFSVDYSGGANYDLGVYLIYLILYLFGSPNRYTYFPVKLHNGIDGLGTLVFEYDDFLVNATSSKITSSHLPSEIQGEEGTILVDKISDITKITLIKDKMDEIMLDETETLMLDEAIYFAEAIQDKAFDRFNRSIDLSLEVLDILEKSRLGNNIIFNEID